jgi:hypothetical protein
MLDGLVPDLAPRLLIAIGGVALAFLVLIAVLLFLRRRNSPLFVKGGRAREHRLLVLDAAAVDAKRRLVLIRRDDTEHLIMIGGPTDIVIETGISGVSRPKAVAPVATPAAQKPAERPVVVQRPSVPERPAERPAAATNIVPIPARPADAAGAQRPNQPRAEGERRQGREQNGERGLNQRRLERQAARAAEAAKSAAQQGAATPVSAPVAQAEKREPSNEAKTETAATASTPSVEPAQQAKPVAAQAENVLDRARDRVLNPPMAQNTPMSHEDAIRQLEEQLEAGKAEAARAEAARAEAARFEAERAAASKADAERAEAVHAEAARLEAVRLEAQKAEAARLEAERAEKQRLEAQRIEAERAEAARLEAEKIETARAEAARAEAERVAAARAEAMARFEAARRAQAEQRLAAQPPAAVRQPDEEQAVLRQAQWPVAEPPVAAASAEAEPQWPVMQPPVAEPVVSPQEEPASARQEPETAELDEAANKSQERLASHFEKLLEAELEADGILDHYPTPTVAGERREPGAGAPFVNPARREAQPITGAVPGISIEQDMARRLGEITLNKKTDAV